MGALPLDWTALENDLESCGTTWNFTLDGEDGQAELAEGSGVKNKTFSSLPL